MLSAQTQDAKHTVRGGKERMCLAAAGRQDGNREHEKTLKFDTTHFLMATERGA